MSEDLKQPWQPGLFGVEDGQPIMPVEPDPEAGQTDPAFTAVVEAENEQRLAEHEAELARIREDEGRKQIEAGIHSMAYDTEAHRIAHDPSILTGEHGLSGYDEMEHRARAAGDQAVQEHRDRVAEIRARADAEYERTSQFTKSYENDDWNGVLSALDAMSAYAVETGNWDEFDSYYGSMRSLERNAYTSHYDALHPETETDPDAPAQPEDGDDLTAIADVLHEGDDDAERASDDGSGADDPSALHPVSPAAPAASADEDREPVAARRRLPSWADDEDNDPATGRGTGETPDRGHPWDDPTEYPSRYPSRDPEAELGRVAGRGVLAGEPLPGAAFQGEAGIPARRLPEGEMDQTAEPTVLDTWRGIENHIGELPRWRDRFTPKWLRRRLDARARRSRENTPADPLDGADLIDDMDTRDADEYAQQRGFADNDAMEAALRDLSAARQPDEEQAPRAVAPLAFRARPGDPDDRLRRRIDE